MVSFTDSFTSQVALVMTLVTVTLAFPSDLYGPPRPVYKDVSPTSNLSAYYSAKLKFHIFIMW